MDDHELLSNGTFLSSDRSMVLERSLSDPDLHERSFREGSLPKSSASKSEADDLEMALPRQTRNKKRGVSN